MKQRRMVVWFIVVSIILVLFGILYAFLDLAVEALFSAYPGVWFNVGVDIGVLALFSIPLMRSLRK